MPPSPLNMKCKVSYLEVCNSACLKFLLGSFADAETSNNDSHVDHSRGAKTPNAFPLTRLRTQIVLFALSPEPLCYCLRWECLDIRCTKFLYICICGSIARGLRQLEGGGVSRQKRVTAHSHLHVSLQPLQKIPTYMQFWV